MNIKVAKKELGGLLKAGDHNVTITTATITMSKEQAQWKDRTPQLEVVCKNKSGQITGWLNLRGYKNSNDFEGGLAPKGHEFRSYSADSEKFLVNSKTNMRVESPERTAKLLENVGNLAFAAGVTDEEISIEELPDALLNADVAVRVRENGRGSEAYYFMQSSAVGVIAK